MRFHSLLTDSSIKNAAVARRHTYSTTNPRHFEREREIREMGRELEIVRLEEAARLPPFSQLKTPYQAALDEEWGAMARFYEKYPERLLDPMTIDKDTAFHIAAYSGETELLQYLLGLLKQTTEISKALCNKNSHGNTAFHEVATTDSVEAAELLISKLREVHGNNPEIRLGEILEDRNQLGETPLYRAAARPWSDKNAQIFG
jgi:ankyrin repeat protein